MEGLWLPQFIAIGEIVSEHRALILDLCKPTKDGQGCQLIEGNPYDPVSYWVKLSESFHDWLDNLISACGSEYWLFH